MCRYAEVPTAASAAEARLRVARAANPAWQYPPTACIDQHFVWSMAQGVHTTSDKAKAVEKAAREAAAAEKVV